jgi:hypothetical protein
MCRQTRVDSDTSLVIMATLAGPGKAGHTVLRTPSRARLGNGADRLKVRSETFVCNIRQSFRPVGMGWRNKIRISHRPYEFQKVSRQKKSYMMYSDVKQQVDWKAVLRC